MSSSAECLSARALSLPEVFVAHVKRRSSGFITSLFSRGFYCVENARLAGSNIHSAIL